MNYWIVANAERSKYLTFTENENMAITGEYIFATGFDDPTEAEECINDAALLASEEMLVQLRLREIASWKN